MGERMASWERDVSECARQTLDDLGNFGPTVNPALREVKGWLHDSDEGGVSKTYFAAAELRRMAADLHDVADWLDREVADEQQEVQGG